MPASEGDWELLKLITAETFAAPLEKWLRGCEGSDDPKAAFAALATWFGHALGASSVHLGLEQTPRIAVSTGELVAECMADDIAAQTFRPTRQETA